MYVKPIKSNDKDFHDSPPVFKSLDRKRFFYVEEHFRKLISDKVRGNANIVYIVVAYGYFKATGQFFDTAQQDDIDFVAGRLKLPTTEFRWEDYRKNTRDRHRELIRDALGFREFCEQNIKPLLQTIHNEARAQKNPERSFITVCQWLFENKVETPNYLAVRNTIDSVYKNHLTEQIDKVKNSLSKGDADLLDQLFEKAKHGYDRWETHRISLVKKFQQSTRTGQIRKNIEAFDLLKPLYDVARPIVDTLDFSQDGLKRYALSVNRRQVFQIKRLKDADRQLHLVIFIVFQFRQLQDLLIDTFLAAVTSAINKADNKAKEEYYRQRKSQTDHTQSLITHTEDLVVIIDQLRDMLTNPALDDSEKIEKALLLIAPKRISTQSVADSINEVQEDLDKVSGQSLFMRFLEEGSLSLQLKCNDIVCRLDFDPNTPVAALFKAVQRFQEKQAQVDIKSPVGFLEPSERRYVDDIEGFRKQLYKVLLFKHLARAIKDGSMNIADSNRYRQLDQYLISKKEFEANRAKLLKLADMSEFDNADAVLAKMELQVDAQFKETNDHILENINEYVEADGVGGFRLIHERNTQAEALLDTEIDIQLFPDNEYIRITEAISTVNKATGFLDEFEHFKHRHLKARPEDRNFYAGIIGLGEHVGIPKLAKLSPEIEQAALESTTKGYFSLENIQSANDAIIRFVNKMPLASVFENEYGLQTSSDGQKWIIAYDSLNANRSFKYGGKDLVVAAYTFIDARGLFSYSTVISGAAREAHYMIDGLLRNDVVRSDMHSTDTHGYTEAVFGATDLLKFAFAPRIKNVGKRTLYSFRNPSYYKRKKYPILPKNKLKIALIKKHWDDILRLVVSMKLGQVTASQIFKRLNSYSSSHNPLYEALREFGCISKTLYILRYADDVDMRKAVHKQLNKGESGNKLDKALAIGRLEYSQTLKEDQEIAESCKRLLKNAVVCWNYMYLSQKLKHCDNIVERALLLKKIKASSLLAWEHFVFHGEFDFSDERLKDSRNFDFNSLLDPDIIKE